jgi:hypothetical protein
MMHDSRYQLTRAEAQLSPRHSGGMLQRIATLPS